MASLSVGLVGPPNCGKSTLFNALTGASTPVAPHIFTTRESVHGVADVRDPRLDALARLSASAKLVPTTLEVVDIAGLVSGSARGEGLGNAFLGQLRTTAATLHVVRCFRDDSVATAGGPVDPTADADTVELELVLADLAAVERRLERVRKEAKGGAAAVVAERDLLERLVGWLEQGRPARTLAADPPQAVDLLTSKPTLYVANVDESGNRDDVQALERFATERGSECVAVNAKLEAELAELEPQEAAAFLEELGIERPALERISVAAQAMLDTIPFFTTGPKDTRAWTIRRGARAPQAAGAIHSDLERGFIRAEVIEWGRLVEAGSEAEAKRRGWVRVEGRDYVVKDGDVLNIRFNV
ncbi:MAG TPA: redox-regulated ATPase YchF [Gaiellales bacterium]|nr:redox-regulated ATPase YchF [Gaiellales bacterium]